MEFGRKYTKRAIVLLFLVTLYNSLIPSPLGVKKLALFDVP